MPCDNLDAIEKQPPTENCVEGKASYGQVSI